MRRKKLGFTLAEVLIVIGIIGVVAALTLPNLNHATGDKEKVTKVKKIYSTLTEAFDRAQAIYGPFDTWFNDLKNSDGGIDNSNRATANERFAKRVTEFMKVSKDCGFEAGCFSSGIFKVIDADSNYTAVDYDDNYLASLQNLNKYMVTLSDDISLAFEYIGYGNGHVGVDIDGPNKGKNLFGDDIHEFVVTAPLDNGDFQVIPSMAYYSKDQPIVPGSYSGSNVTAWVIDNENLDYLKCPEELHWETKTSCE